MPLSMTKNNNADVVWAVARGEKEMYGENKEALTKTSEDGANVNRKIKCSRSPAHVRGKLKASNLSEVIQHSYSRPETCYLDYLKDPSSSPSEMINDDYKVFNDCIHDYISLPTLCVRIIDTPEFQRLRRLKQLGVTHYVYPNATHSRFQHSLGVAHLAGEFAKCIQREEPNLVSDVDVLCLQIAGLCHDLGHGPFSHLWESFVRRVNPECKWNHEENSIKIFDELIEENGLRPLFEQNGLTENDLVFIKEAIGGPLGDSKDGVATYLGRGPEKYFLYEIVANKKTGIDVDKLDYFQRDDYYLNVGTVFKYKRLPFFMKVFNVDGVNRICIRDKEASCLREIFMDRSRLHDRAYQHRVVHIVQLMLMDALLLAEPYIRIKGSPLDDGTNYNLCSFSEATFDLQAFQLLVDDYIFFKIMDSDDPRVLPAQNLLKRIEKREFYSLAAEWMPRRISVKFKLNINKIMDTVINKHPVPDNLNLCREDFGFACKYIDLGAGDKKRKVIFYDKNNCITDEIEIPGLESTPSLTIYIIVKKNIEVIDACIMDITQKWLKYLDDNLQSLCTTAT